MIIYVVLFAILPCLVVNTNQEAFETAKNHFSEEFRANVDEHTAEIKKLAEKVEYLKNVVKTNCNKIRESEKKINQLKRKSASYKNSLEAQNPTTTIMSSEEEVNKSKYFDKDTCEFVTSDPGFIELCFVSLLVVIVLIMIVINI